MADLDLSRMAAALAVSNTPLQQRPPSIIGHDGAEQRAALLLAELEGAGVDLGDYDRLVVRSLADLIVDYDNCLLEVIASWLRRAALAAGDQAHDRDGSCCGLPAGDI